MSSEPLLSSIIPFAGSGLLGYAMGFALKKVQKGKEVKEWVSVDILPDFESKRAKLVFSDNFGEERCI